MDKASWPLAALGAILLSLAGWVLWTVEGQEVRLRGIECRLRELERATDRINKHLGIEEAQ